MTKEEIYVGQTVTIVGQHGPIRWDANGEMELYIGENVTVAEIDPSPPATFRIKEDGGLWVWNLTDAVPFVKLVEPTEEEYLSVLFS